MKINVDESGNTITIIPASTYTIKIKKVQISGKDAFILECGYDTVKYCHDLIEVLNRINKEFNNIDRKTLADYIIENGF
jgi:hypothetical protein